MEPTIFEPDVYVQRRKQLALRIPDSIILLPGNDLSRMNYADNHYPFRQDSNFLYYAGLDLPELVLVLDTATGQEIVFGNEPGLDDIIWTGPLPSLQEQAAATGIKEVKPYQEITTYLAGRQKTGQPILLLPPYRPENMLLLAAWLETPVAGLSKYVSERLIKAVIQQREIKEAVEVEALHKAVSISEAMHLAGMQFARPGVYEYEIAARVEAVALAANSRLSYPTILTVNGQTLHNHHHGNLLTNDKLVLCDAGAESPLHYAGDLTRTYPAGNRFSTAQKEVYQAVLDAMDDAISRLRAGITFKEVHSVASTRIVQGLSSIGLMQGNAEEAVAAGAHTLFFPHGLGHMLGLDVHDMESLGEDYVGYSDTIKRSKEFGWKSLRLARELKAGFTLTIEPGIYFIPELIDRWMAENKHASFINYNALQAYRGFGGIRIEDNFLITDQGSQRLGTQLPKSVEAIEALRQHAS
jgi:Xaa-Pro aminopeptidase